jgi:hypothetical protein
MKIQFLYFEDCPSHELALARLESALEQAGVHSPVEVIQVETDAQARELKFPGSPTIRVDGQDIIPEAPGAPYGLACRAYHLEDGRISPLPSEAMIRRGLMRAGELTPPNRGNDDENS